MPDAIGLTEGVERLKALGEPTRLRIALLLSRSELTVSDLTAILGQSQPRVSRHLRLLVESGVLVRHQEGAWAYFRLSEDDVTLELVAALDGRLRSDDAVLLRDRERLSAVRAQRAAHAATYFAANASRWDRLRSLHAADADVEAALLAELGSEPVEALLDIGTGTGRMLEVLAPLTRRAVGVDGSREMLALARAKLDAAGLAQVSVRHGDAYHLPVDADAFDLVTLHQVLHYLADPQTAVMEAARALKGGGRLAIVDFAPHHHEFLRTEHAHLRLGFPQAAIEGFLAAAGLLAESVRMLPAPSGSPDELTVIVAVGRDPRPAAPALKKTA